jgi:hypothetical protein
MKPFAPVRRMRFAIVVLLGVVGLWCRDAAVKLAVLLVFSEIN